MRACLRPTEAARSRVRKCANNHQLMLIAFKGFYDMHTQPISARKALCALRVYKQTLIGVFSYIETVIGMRVLHDDEICFTSMDAIFKRS